MHSVFIVEDDEQIRNELSLLLSRNGYEVFSVSNFECVISEILAESPDIVLLDLNLPIADGHLICRELREKSDVPIMVVTSRDSDLDELMSMNLGADDFITKPYVPQILLARIATILRRTTKGGSEKNLAYKGIELHLGKSIVSHGEAEVELTKNELRILQVLLTNQEEIVSREDLQHELWQSDEFVDDNTLTVNVNRLRNKLAEIGLDNVLHTKRGLGYVIQK